MIVSCARTNFFYASSIVTMNWLTCRLASHSLWRPRMSSMPAGRLRPVPSFSRWLMIARTETLAKKVPQTLSSFTYIGSTLAKMRLRAPT